MAEPSAARAAIARTFASKLWALIAPPGAAEPAVAVALEEPAAEPAVALSAGGVEPAILVVAATPGTA